MTRIALLLVAVLAVAGCGGGVTGQAPLRPEPGPGPGDVRGEWVVTELRRDGEVVPIPDGVDGSLTLDDRLSGTAFCNGFGAQDYRIEGDRLVVEDLASTLIGCTPEVAMAEGTYLAALNADDVRLAREAERLVIRGGEVEVRLVPRPPVVDVDLTGRWQLNALVDGSMSSSPRQTAELDLRADGTLEGTTGCRPVHGTWQVVDERLVTADVIADGECAPEAAEQDAQVLEVLRQGGAVRIARDHLSLTAPGGAGLQFTTG
ncbi:hypothetical protein DQ237_17695 [Blastococcus sp. TF02-8]|uniref:META domain-containing protein n=1 Tax=Blastococcus sp. TF02-8 TaxID=2250574 RepID=UPI000DE83D38|nr:META domain-containing protein [Blastococcus sp. TF02-8]RBY93450.1 hypothetical protein DQ237_17695 [Blastococcus sp. TF02-8]